MIQVSIVTTHVFKATSLWNRQNQYGLSLEARAMYNIGNFSSWLSSKYAMMQKNEWNVSNFHHV